MHKRFWYCLKLLCADLLANIFSWYYFLYLLHPLPMTNVKHAWIDLDLFVNKWKTYAYRGSRSINFQTIVQDANHFNTYCNLQYIVRYYHQLGFLFLLDQCKCYLIAYSGDGNINLCVITLTDTVDDIAVYISHIYLLKIDVA